MNWYKMVEKELKRVNSGSKMTKVPSNRKPSPKSLINLELEIKETRRMRIR